MENQSTTAIAKRLNTDRDTLFNRFEETGLIYKDNGKWKLTEFGISCGGIIKSGLNSDSGEAYEYIVWSEKIYLNEKLFTDFELNKINNKVELDSEGEEYIADYFDSIGIEYRREELVKNGVRLDKDKESFRRADFYLPKYKLYIEFAGLWSRSESYRENYNIKKQIYLDNGVPCIWIYPDNLGIMHHVFHKRLEKVLRDHKMESELFKFRLNELWKKDGDNFVGILFGLAIMRWIANSYNLSDVKFLIGLGLSVYNVYRITNDFIKIYKGKSLKITRLNKWED